MREIGWFRTALYLFLLYKVIAYVLYSDTLFSSGAMVYARPLFNGGFRDGAFVLSNYYSPWLAVIVIASLGLLAFAGLLRYSGYVARALIWWLMLNVNNYLYATLTAGDYLLNQLLFFNIFLCMPAQGSVSELKQAFHHMALAGIKIQVCLAYVLAAWFKFEDTGWLNGTAVFQAFQIPEYSNGMLMSLPLWLCMIINYATMLYQLLFPFTIWFRPFKIYLLAFGIIQHLIIAFCMGLFSFGITMIICYILFLKYDERKSSAIL